MDLLDIYKTINTPKELYEFMDKYIKYGFYGNDGKIYTNDGTEESDKIFQDACLDRYGLANKEKVLKYGLGQCFDQTELERAWFKEHNYEFRTIFIWFLFDYENTYPTHAYLVYKDKTTNKYYWFEHADSINKGIHEFNSYKEAIYNQMLEHISYTKNSGNKIDDEVLKHIHIYEYETNKYEISFYEFIDNIFESKEITDEILSYGDIDV